ncbi:MAG TPA: class I SAM-dependent methyltransferase [Actinoallomurus sp.]|jgi:predicted O-methyltransferase YrrM|nr:class I SAM-dependent methyltransferase [Actinoallomurus sp.]
MLVLSPRQVTLSVIAGTAVVVAVVVTLGITNVVTATEAVGLSAVVAVLGALVLVVVMVRRVVRRLTTVTRRLSKVDEGLSTLTEDIRLVGKLDRDVKSLERTGKVNYEQLEAYVDIRNLIHPRAPMPSLRGWAASPDVVRFLAEIVRQRHPKLIVECGSGSSGIWLGYFAEQIKPCRVVCLEHDERYWRMSRDLVRAHDLDDVVEVRLAPLADWKHGERSYSWYDVEALEDLTDIGLLFVDGPPGTIGPQARFPAVPVLFPRCDDDAVIVLDDAERGEELVVSDGWLDEYPELERVTLRFDKGAHVFTRQVK